MAGKTMSKDQRSGENVMLTCRMINAEAVRLKCVSV